MKRIGFLYEKIIATENIEAAIYEAARNKKKRKDVQEYLADIPATIKEIQEGLEDGSFATKIHRGRIVQRRRTHKKKRLIIQPTFKESIVHYAILRVISPILKNRFVYQCVGSIPGKGIHKGKYIIEKYIRESFHDPSRIKYILKADVHHFFQSIKPEVLKEKFRRIFKDPKLLRILYIIVDSNKAYFNGRIVNMGLPIGFYTSQWFSNFFLNDFDHFVKEQLHIKCYVRYVDDIVMFYHNKKELRKAFRRMCEFLKMEELEFNSKWQIAKFDYTNRKGQRIGRFIDFLGFRFYRNKTTLRRKNMLKLTRKALSMAKKKRITWFDASQFMSYWGWIKHTDCQIVYQKYIKGKVSIKKCKKILSHHSKLEAIRALKKAEKLKKRLKPKLLNTVLRKRREKVTVSE